MFSLSLGAGLRLTPRTGAARRGGAFAYAGGYYGNTKQKMHYIPVQSFTEASAAATYALSTGFSSCRAVVCCPRCS